MGPEGSGKISDLVQRTRELSCPSHLVRIQKVTWISDFPDSEL
jgi:hypothetical protein